VSPLSPSGIRKRARAARDRRRPPAPFVVGVSRSGTTLLRLMLDAHPEMAIPPETHFLPDVIKECRREGATPDSVADIIVGHRRFADFGLDPDEVRARIAKSGVRPRGRPLRAFYELYAKRQGKRRWGDKTPNYIQFMPRIARSLPEARFIHLVRDGRDVAISRASRAIDDPAGAGFQAKRWKRRINKARRVSKKLEHYMEARYEDLVTDPEPTLRRICEFIELKYDPAMLRYHEGASERLAEMAHDLPATETREARSAEHRMAGHRLATEPPTTDRIARWKSEMSVEDRKQFERFAGELLSELGYEVEGHGEPVGAAPPAEDREKAS
jgi:hypothetical protein